MTFEEFQDGCQDRCQDILIENDFSKSVSPNCSDASQFSSIIIFFEVLKVSIAMVLSPLMCLDGIFAFASKST